MKKAFIMGMMLTFSLSAFSMEQAVVKSCSTVLAMPGEAKKVDMQVDIIEEAGTLSARVNQSTDGDESSAYSDISEISEYSVKSGITGDNDDVELAKMNLAEILISHAISVTTEPEFEGVMSAGLDLSAIRSAKVYSIGKATKFGMTAIIEAKDAEGKDLGSFLGGFLVTPCK